jgi:hypothetical protein
MATPYGSVILSESFVISNNNSGGMNGSGVCVGCGNGVGWGVDVGEGAAPPQADRKNANNKPVKPTLFILCTSCQIDMIIGAAKCFHTLLVRGIAFTPPNGYLVRSTDNRLPPGSMQ